MTFAQSDYAPTSTDSKIELTLSKPLATDYILLETSESGDSNDFMFGTTEFGFGVTYSDNLESYESIQNTETNSGVNLANTTIISLNMVGLGLPIVPFKKFQNLLALATQGEASCVPR